MALQKRDYIKEEDYILEEDINMNRGEERKKKNYKGLKIGGHNRCHKKKLKKQKENVEE